MALHDVDPNSADRGKPKPASHDVPLETFKKAIPFNQTTQGAPLLAGNVRLVKTGTAGVVTPSGTSGLITTTTTTVPHNLGYTPLALAYMNNIIGQGYGQPLPMWVSFGDVGNTTVGGVTVETLGVITFMTYAVDGSNFYVLTYGSGSAIAANYTITYFLYQQRAN